MIQMGITKSKEPALYQSADTINKREEEVPLSGSLRGEKVKRFASRLRTSVDAMIGEENRESDWSPGRAFFLRMGLKILLGGWFEVDEQTERGESAKDEDKGDRDRKSKVKSNPRLWEEGRNRALEIAKRNRAKD